MAQFSSPMDWEPTHRVDYKPAWQPPLSGRFVVVANERDRSEWRPQMPGAFVDTPPRRNEVGLQPRSRKRTAESAQFEDQPRYDDEPASAQPVPFLCFSQFAQQANFSFRLLRTTRR
jgi:hypothetical protein